MAVAGQPIEAILTLNASNFHSQLGEATKGVNAFVNSISKSTGQISGFRTAVDGLLSTLSTTNVEFGKFEAQAKGINSFNQFANGVKALAGAIQTLGGDTATASVGIARIIEIVEAMGGAFGTAEVKVTGLASALRQLKGVEDQTSSSAQKLNTAFNQAKQSLLDMSKGVQPLAKIREQTDMMKAEFDKARSSMLQFAQYGVTAFNEIDAQSNKTKAQVRAMEQEFNRAKAGLMEFARSGIVHFNEISTAEQKTTATTKQLNTALNQASASSQRYSASTKTATASTNQFATATSRLGKAMNSLKMMGSLVGSMLAYNFAHKLLVATGETIHAKSEMEGYFKMLHFGQGEIDKFNSALDDTVKRFQRVNKYSLGETISSIGVEFNLTTDEMIKAMDVTSMITSEYLRAGRNANEASLAVKDVLQGQFQRLSRETGVKGEQLKEAGWNGDVTDVNSLLDALRKVGEDRNWDVFAEKANSLNDILTILQNRFGEWSAEMVNIVQPSIVGAFNAIMGVGGALSGVLEGMWTWINGDGLVETATRWTLIGTAIAGVTVALVHYRTGANLVQMVQMGLRGSLMATVFGLKAEEVALYGSRNALVAKLTSIKAEQVAEMGVRRAIATKVLGLEAEMVANNGLKGAIMSTVLARKLEEAETEGATVAQKAKIVSDHMEEVSNMSTLKAIIAKVAGVEMETFAEKGLVVALAQRIAKSPLYIGSLKAEEIAELSTAQAGMVLMASILPLVAVFIGLAVAVYSVVKPLQDASAEMKAFNNIAQNGEEIVKSHRKTYNSLSESYDEGYAELQKLTKGTDEYIRKENELKTLEKDVATAKQNTNNAYEAYQRTVSAQGKFEEESGKIRIRTQTELADAYIRAGFSAKEASEMASTELQEAEKGAYQLRKALQMLKLESDKHIEKNDKIIDMLDQYGLSDDKIREFGTNLESAQKKIDDGLVKFMTSEDWMERIGGWFEIQQGRLEEWWTEFNAFFEVRDWDAMGQKLLEGLDYVTDLLIPFKSILKDRFKSIGDEGLVPFLMKELFGEGDSDGALDIAWQFLSYLGSELGKMISDFLKDPFGGEGGNDEWSRAVAKFLFGKNEDRTLHQMAEDWLNDNVVKPIQDWFNGFLADPLAYIGNFLQNFTGIGQLLQALVGEDPIGQFTEWISGLFSGGDDFNGMMKIDTTWISNIALGIVDAIRNFDWMGALSTLAEYSPLLNLINAIFNTGDGMDTTWAWDFLNDNIITPIQTRLGMFLADPLSYIGGMIMSTGIGGLINALIPDDGGVSILNYVNTSIIQPFTQGIQTGIASIPILGDIAQMLGLVPQQNENARQTGYNLLDHLKQGVEQKIREIPIIGDIAQMLGLIPQQNGNAHDKGHGVGENIKEGEKAGHQGIADNVRSEMGNVISAISQKAGEAYAVAHDIGSQILNGIKNALDMHSPSIISRELIANEFGVYIPQAISNAGDVAYQTAYNYGSQIKEGISAVNTDVGLGGMVQTYESDAQMVATSSQMMGTTTTTAFNDMSMAVNSTTSQMGTNVATTYSSMQTKQSTALNSMKQKNLTAYNDMYTKSNQSLLQMRDSTSNITHQMTNAWDHMKNQIVASANRLKHDSTVHFNQLSNTIGSFYRKIQNPSSWGAGTGSSRRPVTARRPSVGRRVASSLHGAGSSGGNYHGSSTLTISQLKKKLCPNGDCGTIFDGFNPTDRVDVQTFINSIQGEHGFGSWSSWNGTHYNHIKNKSDQWGMKSPTINLAGGIPTNANYKVGDFENGQPKISFASFQSMAESIFSAIPYRHYYDSSWKGSWLGALQAGACNCSDGADALIAFAGACGFGGHKVHGTWDGEGHFWAVINGKPMDTTAWQKGYGWTSPKVHGYGSPVKRTAVPTSNYRNNNGTTVNVTVDMSGATIYGADDLDNRIEEGIDKGLQKHFNDPYTIAI